MNLIKLTYLIGVISLLTSCLQTEEEKIYNLTLGNITSDQPNEIVLEINDSTLVYDQDFKSDNYKLNDRVMISYTVLNQKPNTTYYEYEIDINYIQKVKTQNIQLVDNISRDTLTQNAVYIDSYGIQDHYLNFQIKYLGFSKPHYFTLAYDTLGQSSDFYRIDFMHNETEESYTSPINSIMSFDLNSIDWQGPNPVKIEINYFDYDDKSKTLKLDYYRALN